MPAISPRKEWYKNLYARVIQILLIKGVDYKRFLQKYSVKQQYKRWSVTMDVGRVMAHCNAEKQSS